MEVTGIHKIHLMSYIMFALSLIQRITNVQVIPVFINCVPCIVFVNQQ
jgi:hypothetical protein